MGKSITPGFRNITLETRAFGVPCIRTDLPAPPKGNMRSVANNMNYGDDATASELINPQPFADLRITETSMYQERSKESIFAFFEKIGFSADKTVMDACFRAVSEDGYGASLQAYRHKLNGYFEACDTGEERAWRIEHGI